VCPSRNTLADLAQTRLVRRFQVTLKLVPDADIVGVGSPIHSSRDDGHIERDMRIEAIQNMLWVIPRAHVSSLQLSEAVARRTAGEADRSELELRYDMFLSRLRLLDDGSQCRRMEEPGFVDALDGFRRDLPELDALVVGLEPHQVQRPLALLPACYPYFRLYVARTNLYHAEESAVVAIAMILLASLAKLPLSGAWRPARQAPLS
jgi:hypothetical protein